MKVQPDRNRKGQEADAKEQIRLLQDRLKEAEDTLNAIRDGDVDTLIVPGPQGQKVYSLQNPVQDYQVMIESMNEGALTLEQDGQILYANPSFAKMVGRPSSELIGVPVQKFAHRDDVRIFDERIARAVHESGKIPLRLCRRDGHEFMALVSVNSLATGSRPMICMVITDLTEAKRQETRLIEEQERYHLLFENAPYPMIVYDVQTLGYLAVNEAVLRQYGYSREEFLTMTLKDIRPPQDVAKLIKMLPDIQTQSEIKGRFTYRRKNGTLFEADVTSHALTLEGRLARLAVIVDVTESRRLEEQLRQAQKMESVGRLAGGVAHDFNNILTIMKGYVNFLLKRFPENDETRRDILEIRKATDQAASLTRQLLAFSRKQVLQPKVVQLNDVVSNIERMLGRVIGEDVELIVNLDSSLGNIRADPGQLEQILMNLAVNARDAMPDGGRLTIETTCTAEVPDANGNAAIPRVILQVSDNGCGMDPATQGHLFEPFFTTKGPGQGTGLGLATVYGIVQQSGGTIHVESATGKGTTFRIEFPVAQRAADLVPASPLLVTDHRGSETILVVEDEPHIRVLLLRILSQNGYTVYEASQGEEALVLCERYRESIDLIMTDMVMPKMGGEKFTETIHQKIPNVKIIYMSGYTDNLAVERRLLKEGTAFLQKPFDLNDVINKVRQLLDSPLKKAA